MWGRVTLANEWTMSKAIAQLLHGGVAEGEIVELIMRHVGRHIASSHGLDGGEDVSRLINGLKVGQRYEGEDRLIALAIAARSAAGSAAQRNENVPMPPPYDWARTARWVRSFARDRMGNRIERCLYTAWREGDGDRILPLLLDCAVEPHFLDFGDSLVSLAYLAELQELFGWDHAGELIFNLGAKLIGQQRHEPERFRRDAVNRMRERLPVIEAAAQSAAAGSFDEDALVAAVASVDVARSFDALEQALASGASIDRLITTFVMLAADRMARTPVSVDAGWPQLTRELNIASALRSAKKHGGGAVAAKGLFHAAWHTFADRWINVEHRPLGVPPPEPPPGADEDAACAAILRSIQTLDVEAADRQVSGYLQAGFPGDRLLHEMGAIILRDDTGHEVLPTLRTVFEEWGNATGSDAALGAGHPARGQLLVGLARYATDVRANSDGRSAAATAMRFAEGKTTIEMFEQ